jgi:hypothetical protein
MSLLGEPFVQILMHGHSKPSCPSSNQSSDKRGVARTESSLTPSMLCVFAFFALVTFVSAQIGNIQNEKGGFNLSWNITALNDPIEPIFQATLTLNGTAFIAMGLGTGMQDADIIIGYVDSSGRGNISDCWSEGHSRPTQDFLIGGTADVFLLSASRTNSTTTLEFYRKLDTNDKMDKVIKASGAVDVIYAWNNGSPGNVSFHFDNHNHLQVGRAFC